jgi:hypothetical protein
VHAQPQQGAHHPRRPPTSGAFVVWLDQVLPMYRKDQFKIECVVGMSAQPIIASAC